MIYEGKYYFYVKNLQGDIVSIVDESGTAIVNYSYDSWGRLLQIEGSKKDTIGVLIIKGEKSAVVFTPPRTLRNRVFLDVKVVDSV